MQMAILFSAVEVRAGRQNARQSVRLVEAKEWEMEEETTVSTIYESIETNLWQSAAYARQGCEGLSLECLRAAWLEFVRFSDVLRVYAGSETLRQQLIQALAAHADCPPLQSEDWDDLQKVAANVLK